MVDNFDLMKENLVFPNERAFYFIQILKRNKDNPEQKAYSRPIECFYVFSAEHFERLKPHIIEKCEQNRARAYIKMNPLDIRSVAAKQAQILLRAIMRETWKDVIPSLNSACGQGGIAEKDEKSEYGEGDVHVRGFEKLHLIDLDDISDDPEVNRAYREEIRTYINSLPPLVDKKTKESIVNKVRMEVPTKSGYHFLCTGFDLKQFRDTYSKVDVHKEGNTVLYIPESICKK